jgi:hypothetical protein
MIGLYSQSISFSPHLVPDFILCSVLAIAGNIVPPHTMLHHVNTACPLKLAISCLIKDRWLTRAEGNNAPAAGLNMESELSSAKHNSIRDQSEALFSGSVWTWAPCTTPRHQSSFNSSGLPKSRAYRQSSSRTCMTVTPSQINISKTCVPCLSSNIGNLPRATSRLIKVCFWVYALLCQERQDPERTKLMSWCTGTCEVRKRRSYSNGWYQMAAVSQRWLRH